VTAVSETSRETFDELFERERQAMVRVAYLIAGSTAVAEEVTQDAFVTVYERWDRLDCPGGYLRRCVVNKAVTAARRRRRGEELLAISPALLPAEADPGHDHVLDAVRRLGPRARALVVLRYYDHLTVPEIAQVLGIPAGTVKSGLHRALAGLREVRA
jgi:RNA polymerase sigma-70 factor (sigma-E family)